MGKNIFLIGKIGLVALLFSGCSWWHFGFNEEESITQKRVVVEKIDKEDIREVMKEEKMLFLNNDTDRVFGAIGEGIAPLHTISPAQALALAKRAAMADAYRQLGAKLYGVKITSKDTVKDAALSDSRIVTQVNGLIKNATIIDTSYIDGLYRVTMELKMSEDRWREIFSY